MELGMIGWIEEEDFKKAKDLGLSFIELDVNNRDAAFLAHLQEIKEYSKKYDMPIGAVGRWGLDKITKDGTIETEYALNCRLIDAAAFLGSDIYMTGCNYIEELSFYDNASLAIAYLGKLAEYGKNKGVKVAVYNCRWNNFICSEREWNVILDKVPDLYIKYDPSHCIYAGGDYLKETRDFAHKFAHVHIKGSLLIDGERYDDPPAGLDQTDWRSFLSILYTKGYEGRLSIEPHSEYWKGELGEKGLRYTVAYMKQLLLS